MSCTSCGSDDGKLFVAEINIQFNGFRNVNEPGILAFPRISVCFDCGSSEFTLPTEELRLLGNIASVATGHRARTDACP